MEFGEVLRELLEERGISQKKMAEDLNMAVSTLGNYIRDNREPDFKTLKRMADYFQVSVDYLLDHPYQQTENHKQDHLLELFRIMTPQMQEIYLEQGKILVKHSLKKETISFE